MSYFCVNHSDMKTTQEIIAILRHFKMTEGDRYGISRLGIFGSVAMKSRTNVKRFPVDWAAVLAFLVCFIAFKE